jgi:hypothetical protein
MIKWDSETIMVDELVECHVGHADGLTYLHSTIGRKYCYTGSTLKDAIKTAKACPMFYIEEKGK